MLLEINTNLQCTEISDCIYKVLKLLVDEMKSSKDKLKDAQNKFRLMLQRDESFREHEIQMDLLKNQLTESRNEMERILDQNAIYDKIIKEIRSFIYISEHK